MEDEELYNQNMTRVAKAENAPVVFFPYGFKFIDVEGQTFMTPIEREEYESLTGSMAGPLCGTLSYRECYRGSGCGPLAGMCTGRYAFGGYICQCAGS